MTSQAPRGPQLLSLWWGWRNAGWPGLPRPFFSVLVFDLRAVQPPEPQRKDLDQRDSPCGVCGRVSPLCPPNSRSNPRVLCLRETGKHRGACAQRMGSEGERGVGAEEAPGAQV